MILKREVKVRRGSQEGIDSGGAVGPLARRLWPICLLVVFLLTFLSHARSINYPFSDFDDPVFVSEVTGYRGLGPANIAWDFTTVKGGHYQPLTYLSYGIDYVLWGKGEGAEGEAALNPTAFHFTNVFLHALNAVLVALLARRLVSIATSARSGEGFTITAATTAALVFGLHPLRVESVAWITERRDVLSGLFLLSATLAYLNYARPAQVATGNGASPDTRPPFRLRPYVLALFLLLLSLLSKAWGMSFFVVILILDMYPLARLPALPWMWRGRHASMLLEKIPFAILGIIAAAAAAYAQGQSRGTVRTLEEWGIAQRAAQTVYGLVFYVWKTVWPTSLAPLYELRTDTSPTEPRFLAAFAVVAAATILIVAFRRKAPALAAVGVCYVVLVSPVLGILQSGIQLVADRYSYIACIPWALLAGWAIARLAIKVAPRPDRALRSSTSSRIGVATLRPVVLALTGVALLALAAASWTQTQYWKSSVALFGRSIDAGWDGPLARVYLGRGLEKLGRFDEAKLHYQKGIESGDPEGNAAFHLANILRDSGDFAGAERMYNDALTRRSDQVPVYLGLGILYLKQDRYAEAVRAFRGAVDEFEKPGRAPDPKLDGVAYLNLAGAMDMGGDLLGSRDFLVKATKYPLTKAEAERILKITDEELRATGQR